jgi:hypothetical protein
VKGRGEEDGARDQHQRARITETDIVAVPPLNASAGAICAARNAGTSPNRIALNVPAPLADRLFLQTLSGVINFIDRRKLLCLDRDVLRRGRCEGLNW